MDDVEGGKPFAEGGREDDEPARPPAELDPELPGFKADGGGTADTGVGGCWLCPGPVAEYGVDGSLGVGCDD